MTGTLPAGDRGYRSGDSGRQSGSPWTVFGAVGLVCGITYTPERGTPPGGNPAAPNEQVGGESGPNRIGALRIFAFGRRDRQTQLLSHGPGQEAADRMCLAASGLHQFRKSGAVRPFQQIEDLGSLASVPRRTILFGSFWPPASLGWPSWPSSPSWPQRGRVLGQRGPSCRVSASLCRRPGRRRFLPWSISFGLLGR